MTMTIRVTQFTRRPPPGAFSIERVFGDVRAALPKDVAVRERQNMHVSRGVLARLRDALAARHHAGVVNHVTGDVHYLTYFLPRARTVLTVHDTVFVERERGLKRFLLWLFWLRLPAWRCARMTTISEESKRRLLGLIRYEPSRIEVIPDPVSPHLRPRPLPARHARLRLLHIGTKPNKNLERVLDALSGLELELTIVGRLSERQHSAASKSGLDLRLLSALSDDEIRAEYARADALVFVSLEEGFGLPIIEAQATGRPVLTSDRSPMSDVAGGAALCVDPLDAAAIRGAVERLIAEPALCDDLVQRGFENARRFEASAVAAQYADLYRRIAASNETQGDP